MEHIAAFKTPTLREIAATDPYMHDGSLETLEEVIDFYDEGGVGNPFLDNEMRRSSLSLVEMLDSLDKKEGVKPDNNEGAKLNLTAQEKEELLAFLKTLNGRGWQNAVEPDSFPK
jgi:cytochrome c peroxidase